MFESNFKEINFRKLCDKAILIKCILTLDDIFPSEFESSTVNSSLFLLVRDHSHIPLA